MEYKLAVIEDELTSRNLIYQMLKKYENERKISLNISCYSDAYSFFIEPHHNFDAIFLDIQMPGLNGIEAARRIRRENPYVLLIFVTNMAQYAIEGYEVRAYDFLLKPLQYSSFSMKLDRICKELNHLLNDAYLNLSTKGLERRVRILDILYVEVINHYLIFHLSDEDVNIRGTMKELEKQLEPYHFVRCNSCYLINMKYVRQFNGQTVLIGTNELRVSQSKRRPFLVAYAKYAGGTV